MARTKSWVLTDAAADVWLESFHLSSREFGESFAAPWSISKRTLRAGMCEGVDLIEVNNGVMSFSILPTRGMGLWRGQCKGYDLGWTGPTVGPVHPNYVRLLDRKGLGWLQGFNEWVCRCGLYHSGPPGTDPQTGEFLTLHGRIANLPAHHVEVRIDLDPPHELSVVGEVDEAALFFPHLRLTSGITTVPGSTKLMVQDMVQNLKNSPAELQLLYHCQFGPPFLEPGSRVVVPAAEVAPKDARSAEDMDAFDCLAEPTPGFAEQVYYYDPLADESGQCLALLHNANADLGVCLRWVKPELPRFTVWKHTAGLDDGYVVGLEPATNFPNFKAFEREQGRVVALPPKGFYTSSFTVEVLTTAVGVAGVLEQIDTIQDRIKPQHHREPKPEWSVQSR